MNNKTLMLENIHDKIQIDADMLKAAVTVYAEYVWNGGDPTKLPDNMPEGFTTIYNNDVTRFVPQIVNSYRMSLGKEPNPYHAWQYGYKAFDYLLEANGEWVLGKTLRSKIFNHHVETFLKPRDLKEKGWLLQKSMIRGKVHYRLVTLASMQGFGPVATIGT